MSNTSVTITTLNRSVTFEIKTTSASTSTTMSAKTPCRYGDFCYNKSCKYLHDKTHPIHGAQGGASAPCTGTGASAPRTGASAPRTGASALRTGTGASAPRTGTGASARAPVRTYKMEESPGCKCNYWHFCGPRCTNMCNDFARNGCPRGQNCRFEHYVEPLSYN